MTKVKAIFKGSKELGGGIYLIVYPTKDKFLEILIDKKQHFSVIADTADPTEKKFINSPDNDLFNDYQKYMAIKGKAMDAGNKALKDATTAKDSAFNNRNAEKNIGRNFSLQEAIHR